MCHGSFALLHCYMHTFLSYIHTHIHKTKTDTHNTFEQSEILGDSTLKSDCITYQFTSTIKLWKTNTFKHIAEYNAFHIVRQPSKKIKKNKGDRWMCDANGSKYQRKLFLLAVAIAHTYACSFSASDTFVPKQAQTSVART